jgi:hypothetical protein
MIHPGVQIKPVKGDALLADGNFSQIRPDFGVESVTVHAEITRSIPEPEQAGQQANHFVTAAHSASPASKMVTIGLRPGWRSTLTKPACSSAVSPR